MRLKKEWGVTEQDLSLANLFAVPSVDTPVIQEMHIMAGHIICNLVETAIFR